MRAAVLAIAAFVVVALAPTGVAHAQPWAEGVSAERKADAQGKLEAGNKLFLAQQYKDALVQYQAAIAAWDHPAIRFNVVRCLVLLDRPVEASDNLQAALKYGAAPLEDMVYREALAYQKLLAKQIAEVEITCRERGAKVSLDGKPFMTCPGTEKRRVTPGEHAVIAVKDGFLPKQLEVVVVGGTSKEVSIEMIRLDRAAKVVHRWPGWIPWVVLGGSVAVAGVGGLIEYSARDLMADYDRTVARECDITPCDLEEDRYAYLRDQKATAERRDRIGMAVISVGVAGAVAGGVLLFMNRGRTVYSDTAEHRPAQARLDFVPSESGGGVLTLSGGF